VTDKHKNALVLTESQQSRAKQWSLGELERTIKSIPNQLNESLLSLEIGCGSILRFLNFNPQIAREHLDNSWPVRIIASLEFVELVYGAEHLVALQQQIHARLKGGDINFAHQPEIARH
jgi:hypothetical protein